MDISKPKYEIGQTVWFCGRTFNFCGECGRHKSYGEFQPKEFEIEGISKSFSYFGYTEDPLSDDVHWVDEIYLFATREEAQAECDKRNEEREK